MKNYFILFFCFLANFIHANFTFENTFNTENKNIGNEFYLDPKISKATYQAPHIKQKGYLYGIEGGYDLLVINTPYLGCEASYLKGKIKGSNLESTYCDYLFEGKVGFTLGIPRVYYFTPYAGVGYENEKNNYTTIPLEKLSYYYISLGIVSDFYFSPNYSAGLAFKLKFPFSGDHDVENDTINTRVSICKKIQYQIAVPFTYWASNALSISAVPYYQNKKYNNNPVSTVWKSSAKMHQWGLGLTATLLF